MKISPGPLSELIASVSASSAAINPFGSAPKVAREMLCVRWNNSLLPGDSQLVIRSEEIFWEYRSHAHTEEMVKNNKDFFNGF